MNEQELHDACRTLREMTDAKKRKAWDEAQARHELIQRIRAKRRAPNCSGRGVRECERRLRQMQRDSVSRGTG